MRRIFAFLLLTMSLLSAPLAVRVPNASSAGQPEDFSPAAPIPPVKLPYQVGIASWYGSFFQGKETTSGHPFNMWAMTAAHRTLPLGTRVRVTNLANNLAVILRINDRGPVPDSRIIDLSYGAARALHFSGQGLAPVRIDILARKGPLGVTASPNATQLASLP
ncbi:MAG: septal ring lytic transglycosylase RlpA family protein [Acidobacteria bacterium]|nr:MAG: septal ring lytic transglycosylase RlpA family protein [Acidobacteriota bacterium]